MEFMSNNINKITKLTLKDIEWLRKINEKKD